MLVAVSICSAGWGGSRDSTVTRQNHYHPCLHLVQDVRLWSSNNNVLSKQCLQWLTSCSDDAQGFVFGWAWLRIAALLVFCRLEQALPQRTSVDLRILLVDWSRQNLHHGFLKVPRVRKTPSYCCCAFLTQRLF